MAVGLGSLAAGLSQGLLEGAQLARQRALLAELEDERRRREAQQAAMREFGGAIGSLLADLDRPLSSEQAATLGQTAGLVGGPALGVLADVLSNRAARAEAEAMGRQVGTALSGSSLMKSTGLGELPPRLLASLAPSLIGGHFNFASQQALNRDRFAHQQALAQAQFAHQRALEQDRFAHQWKLAELEAEKALQAAQTKAQFDLAETLAKEQRKIQELLYSPVVSQLWSNLKVKSEGFTSEAQAFIQRNPTIPDTALAYIYENIPDPITAMILALDLTNLVGSDPLAPPPTTNFSLVEGREGDTTVYRLAARFGGRRVLLDLPSQLEAAAVRTLLAMKARDEARAERQKQQKPAPSMWLGYPPLSSTAPPPGTAPVFPR